MLRKASLAALVLGGSTFLGLVLLRSIAALNFEMPPTDLLSRATQNLILTLGLIAAAWYFVTAVGVMLTATLRAVGAAPARLEHALSRYGAPLLRRVATWTTVSTIALASPAIAANAPEEPPSDPSSVITEESASRNTTFLVDLGWSATPTVPAEDTKPSRQSGSSPTATRSAEKAEPPLEEPPPEESTQETRSEAHRYVVQPGDTLWEIAETHLRKTTDRVTTADVAAHWPRWHAENRATIGADPHLITPGMTLHAPTMESP